MNLGSSVVEALSEGATLAVVFLAVEVLSAPEGSRFNFPCASGTKVGDLTDFASQGPEAIRIQVEQSGQLLVLLLGGASSYGEKPGLASP